jgi:hypothetical protein
MAVVPGTTSGTYGFDPSNAAILFEAFDRIKIRPQLIDRHMLQSGRMSMNLELVDWSNSGFNLWKEVSGTINLVPGTATYSMPTNLVTLAEVYYSTVNGDGSGVNEDRIMVPITRTQYAMIPNKLQQGQPTQYWYQMLVQPQVTLWEVPYVGAPTYVVNWFGLQQIQDVGIGTGQIPDVIYRGLEAFCANLALRLFDKFGPENPASAAIMLKRLETNQQKAWDNFLTRDQETGPLLIQPNVGTYGQMRGGR